MPKLNRRLAFQSLDSRHLLTAVGIGQDLAGQPAQTFQVPVSIDDSAGVRAAEITLRYDTSLLDLDSESVALGSVWSGAADAQVTANVDDATGSVVIFVSSSEGLPTGAGSLVLLTFSVASDASLGTTTPIDLTGTTLNEGAITLDRVPVAGNDPTDGLVTVVPSSSGDERVGGFVYADTNGNRVPDTAEGIPGVVLTMRNLDSGSEQQTITQADGSYQFENLAPGSYEITQQQPFAYLDGGVNAQSVTVSANQTVENQNFHELGLKPQYVYNRFFTSTVRPVGSDVWTEHVAQVNDDARAEAAVAASTSVASTFAASTFAASTFVAGSAAATPALSALASGEPLIDAILSSSADSDGLDETAVEGAAGEQLVPVEPVPIASMADDDDERTRAHLAAAESVDRAIDSGDLW